MDEKKKAFLEKVIREYYSQGDSYHVYKSKKGNWSFGYSNDYPMQHGDGKTFTLPDEIVTILMNS